MLSNNLSNATGYAVLQ